MAETKCKKRVLVTGATGFIGHAVLVHLSIESNIEIRAAIRQLSTQSVANVEYVYVKGLEPHSTWDEAVADIDVIVHTAARVHIMNDTAQFSEAEFYRVNVEGTLNLARQAAEAGVQRFIFISSIKVNGEETLPGKPFKPEDMENPVDAYAASKLQAELELKQVGLASGMEIVVIRPPLVYGPGVKANFLSMMTWLYKGIPLPFGAVIHNKRSLVALENLVDFVVTCIDHPLAANQTFLVSDGEDLSTAELLIRMGGALGRPPRLVAVPLSLLTSGATLFGRRKLALRLLNSLQIDKEKTRNLLGWRPPLSVDSAFEQTARFFQVHMKR